MRKKINWPFAKRHLRECWAEWAAKGLQSWIVHIRDYGGCIGVYQADWPDAVTDGTITIDANGDCWQEVPFSCDDREEPITRGWAESIPDAESSLECVRLRHGCITIAIWTIRRTMTIQTNGGEIASVKCETRGKFYDLAKLLEFPGPWL